MEFRGDNVARERSILRIHSRPAQLALNMWNASTHDLEARRLADHTGDLRHPRGDSTPQREEHSWFTDELSRTGG